VRQPVILALQCPAGYAKNSCSASSAALIRTSQNSTGIFSWYLHPAMVQKVSRELVTSVPSLKCIEKVSMWGGPQGGPPEPRTTPPSSSALSILARAGPGVRRGRGRPPYSGICSELHRAIAEIPPIRRSELASGLSIIHTAMWCSIQPVRLQPHETSSSGSASALVKMYS
jgi:hypothetical protein